MEEIFVRKSSGVCFVSYRILENSPRNSHRIESRSRTRNFPTRSQIYLPQDSGEAVLLLLSGRVKLYHITAEGKETILAFIEPGELFGELSLVQPGGRDEFAEAMQKCQVVLIPGDEVRRLMETHADVALKVTKLFGLRMQRIERRLKSLMYRSNRERLVALLLELAERYGRNVENGVQIGIRLSHQELASVIGATRETVTVLLGNLRDEELLSITRRQLVLHDVARLAASIGERPPAIPAPPPIAVPAPGMSVVNPPDSRGPSRPG
jgi:CRP/FNR family transcriptional regulator, cyclic AMP receptor protein